MDINKQLILKKFNSSDVKEIDLKSIFNFFLRNKILISSFTIVTSILFCLYSLNLKRIWEGKFQIVVNDKNLNSSNLNPNNLNINNILGTVSNNDLATEVGILNSPSILMPIFNFVKQSKKLNESQFINWKKNLSIKLQNNTSILNISYQDQEKELIIPVLNKISSAYQIYSGKEKKLDQINAKKYLINQIDIYKSKSSKSLKTAQEYAIENNLFYPFSYKALNLEIEKIRIEEFNRINKIDLQIQKIREIGDDSEFNYIGTLIPELVEQELTKELSTIEREIITARTKYTESDLTLISLLEARDLLIKLLKNRTLSYLQTRRLESEAIMNSASRPKEVLLKYKILLREAVRDESTLVELEKNLTLLNLEIAKSNKPWELITKPTLLNSPVAPNRTKIGISGLLVGLILGSLIAFLNQRRSGRIYEPNILEDIFSAPILEEINLGNNYKENNFPFLREYIYKNISKKICFYTFSYIENEKIKKLKELIFNTKELEDIKNINFALTGDDLKFLIDADIKILVASLENLELKHIEKFSRNFNIFNLNVSGIIILNS